MEDIERVVEEIPDIHILSQKELLRIPPVRIMEHMEAISDEALTELREVQAAPDGRKFTQHWNTNDAARLLGRSKSFLAQLRDPDLRPAEDTKNANWRSYPPEVIYRIRQAKQVPPFRSANKPAVVLGVAMQKGGVGKTTTSLTLTHFLASRGYRVLLVDLDAQGSNTSAYEVADDEGVLQPCGVFVPRSWDQTVAAVLVGAPGASLLKLARRTHWPNVDIVPSAPSLVRGEMDLVLAVLRAPLKERFAALQGLRDGLADAAFAGYDVIIVDTPPGMSLTKIATDLAVDALLVPSPMRPFDTHSLFTWAETTSQWMHDLDPEMFKLKWFRVLPTMFNGNSKAELRVHAELEQRMGGVLLPPVPFLEAIKRGGGSAPSIFEKQERASDASAAKKAREAVWESYSQILELINHIWQEA